MKDKRNPAHDLDEIMPLLLNIWRRFHKEAGPADVLQTREFRGVVNAVTELQKGLEDGKTLIGEDYFNNPKLLGAYLLYQWVVHYQQGLSILGELPTVPSRVLDVCSGPAPLAFAALRHGCNDVYAVDRNVQALELGASVCGRYGLPLTVRRWDCIKGELPLEGKFDLIMVGHCIEELFPEDKQGWEDRQNAFIKRLIKRLTPTGYLILIESSLPEANKRILQLRDYLVLDNRIPVQAPCVWKGECPALKAKSQCYAQREFYKPYLIKEIQRAVGINLSSLKMTYLIIRNPESGWPKLPERVLNRVISPPLDSFQGKRFYLCGTEGRKILESHLEEHPKDSRAFDYLRRGELISIENALETPGAYDIIEGTKIIIEAPCGKPIPSVDTPQEEF